MVPCLFSCFPSILRLGEEQHPLTKKRPSPLQLDADGMLRVPIYRRVRREACPLLQHSWEQEWMEVLQHCWTHPQDALTVTQHSGRTALHLATFNHPCPLTVAEALLNANRHMILVQDANWYTPLHNVCFFPGEVLVKLFCDTAVMVEQELQGVGIPPTSGTSPLFLAAKRAAPLPTLRYLLHTRSRTEWIAPSTGSEPYWMDSLDEYSSPLEILLRDRAASIWFATSLVEAPELQRTMKQYAYRRLREWNGIVILTQAEEEEEEAFGSSEQQRFDDFGQDELRALDLWEKCIELLAEHTPRLQPSNDDDTAKNDWGVLHAISCAKVPIPSLLQVALAVFPEQTLQRDEHGMLPLHHVLLAKHPYATQTLVSALLQHSPEAAQHRMPDEGPTPLSLALHMKLPTDILSELLAVDSYATLGMAHPGSGMYPFAAAASRDYELDVIFSLLVAHPQILGHHVL
jgi:hypothetical protein